MKRKYTLLSVLLYCFLIQITVAQNALYFKSINKNNGLSSNRVNCIFEDNTGFMWFGTQDGLSQYNGYDFDIFLNDPNDPHSITNNAITAIAEEKETGNLWIGTAHGLNYFDRNTYKFTSVFSHTDKDSLSNQEIFSLYHDSRNNLWIGTANGLNCYDANKKLKRYFHDPNTPNSIRNNTVYTIQEDKKQNLWIGTDDGLDLYNRTSDNFKHFTKNPKLKYIRAITVSSKNELWIGTYRNGLFRMKNEGTDTKMNNYTTENGYLINNRVSGVAEGEFGNIYITDRDGGLIVFNVNDDTVAKFIPNKYSPNSLSSKALISIAKSSSGIIWIGSFNSGVDYIDNKRKQFEHFKINFKDDGLFNNNIRSMFQDSQGNVWIGTKEEGGLSMFNRKKGTFVHYKPNKNDPNSLNHDYVFSINEIDERYLLVGTFLNGLNILDKTTGRFSHYKSDDNDPYSLSDDRIYALFKDINNTVWVGTYGTSGKSGFLNILDSENKTFKQIKKITQARCFCDEDKESIWIGTYTNGLYLYNHKLDKIENYQYSETDHTSISNNNITTIKKDLKGNLWIGTDGGGLNLMNLKSKQFVKYTVKDGLPNNRILGLEIDDHNNLWISTANGLSKFNPIEQTFRNYDVNDGLQGNEFEMYVALKTDNGEMYFGGRNGFNVFNPDNIKDNIIKPEVVITNFKIFNKEAPINSDNSPLKNHISKTEKLVLNHKQSVITFDFVTLNYSSPEKNQYAYRLEDLEVEWNYCGTKRNATYTSLPAGTYNFHVKASNNDNYWNEKGKTITLVILPPFWLTWWFKSIVTIIILGGLTLFFIIRLKMVKKQKIMLEKIVDERTKELKDTNSMLEEKQEQILQQNDEIQAQSGKLKMYNSKLEEQKSEVEKVYNNILILSEFGQKLTASLDIKNISQMLYDYISSLMDVSAFGIGIYNEEMKKIVFDFFIENNKKIPPFTRSIDNKNSLVSWCFNNQKAVFVNDWEVEYKNYVEQMPKYSTVAPPLSNIHLPLTFENKPIGVIAVNSYKKNAYSKNNLTNMQTVASYLVIALENANAYKTIDEKNTSIEGSIRYAETIQQAILPPKPKIDAYFDNFILYKPRDIVSGDFYWMYSIEAEDLEQGVTSTSFVATIDCTGHGVPGAFMSIIGSTHLNEIIKKIQEPYQMLEKLNEKVKLSLKQNETENDDGMDVCLCKIDTINDKYKVTFAGAKRPLYIYCHADKKTMLIKGSLKSIGGTDLPHLSYSQNVLMLEKNDVLYLTSDGYTDQCNPKRKNYTVKTLLTLLKETGDKPMNEQHNILENSLNKFKAYEKQRDDITIIGIKL